MRRVWDLKRKDLFRVHQPDRSLFQSVRQARFSPLISARFCVNMSQRNQLDPPKSLPQESRDRFEGVNHAGDKRAEDSQEESHGHIDIVSGPETGSERAEAKENVFEGGAWMRPLAIAFGVGIAVVCALAVPSRASAATGGARGGISKVAVAKQGAPQKPQQLKIEGK